MPNYLEKIGAWPEGSGHMLRNYAIGYVLSLILTLIPVALLIEGQYSPAFLYVVAVIAALVQFGVQIMFFLHLSVKNTDRERLVVFGSFVAIVCILVAGSLWVMENLNGRMMPTTQQMEEYMQSEDLM